MRQSWNLRMNARALPQRLQRVYRRTLNFGSRDAFTSRHVFAKVVSSRYLPANGMPSRLNNVRHSRPSRAVVTTVMSIPCTAVT